MLKKILNDDLLRHSAIVSVGYIASALIGLVSFIIIARNLGPDVFGVFSVALGCFMLAGDLVDAGLNSSIIKFFHQENRDKNLQSILTVKIGLSVAFLVISLPLSYLISTVLKSPELFWPVALSLACVGLSLIYNYVVYVFQARKDFTLYSLVNISSNTIRLILVLIIIVFLKFAPLYSALILYFVTPILALLVFGKWSLPLFSKIKLRLASKDANMWKFGRNITASFAVSAVSSKFDIFFLTRYAGVTQTGLYSAPMRLFSPVSQLSGALSTVQGPHFSSSEGKWKQVFIKAFALSGLVSLGLIFISFFSDAVLLIFGSEYTSSGNIFRVLCFSFAIFAISVPFYSALVYRHEKSKVIFINAVIVALVSAASLYILVPMYGGLGAAWASLIANSVSTLVEVSVFVYILLFHAESHHSHHRS